MGPAVEETGYNYENDNRNCEEAVVLSLKNGAEVESSKVPGFPLNNNCSSVGIQVSPSPQYRLRFLPICGCTSPDNGEWQSCSPKRLRFLLRFTGRWMFSQCGLGILLFIWALLGAAAFRATEGPQEEEVAKQLAGKQKELVVELATDLRLLKQEGPEWSRKIEFYVDQHKELLLQAVSSGYGEGGSKGKIWSYAGCLLFAVSLLTTLGELA